MPHRKVDLLKKRSAASTLYDAVGVVVLGDVMFEVLHGLGATVEPAERGTPGLIATAYAGLAKQEGLHPDAEPKRAAVIYALQKAWYEMAGGGEPPRVKSRRTVLWGLMREATGASRGERPKADRTFNVALLVRKALLDGTPTKEIIATVKLASPESKCDAKTVAGYRYELKKKGQLT